MKRYETYKESHQDFGEIPVNWNTTKLKFIASEDKNSFVDGPFGSDLKNEEYVESGIPVIQLNSIKEGKLRLNNFKYVTDEKASSLFRHTAFPGDLVIAKMAAPIARSAVVPDTFEKYIIVADCIKLKTKKHQNVSFINYVMNTPFIVAQAERFANGTTRSRVNLGIIKNLVIPLPSYEEQLEIVKFLDYKIQKIDQLVESVQKKVELLEQQRQSIITEAVTKGLNPNVKMKDSGVEWIGEIPEHWSSLALKHIASEKKHSFVDGPFGSDLKNEEYVDSGVPVIQLNNIKNGDLRVINMNFVTKEKSEQLKRHIAYPGDLVIAKMASPIARSAIVPKTYENYVIVADCIKLKLKENYLNHYINFAMNTPFTIAQAESFANGTTRSRVNLSIIKNLKLPIPNFEEQKEIASYLTLKVSEVNSVIKAVENQIQKLKEYRQSLIYEAVTGKIDVRDMELDEVR